MARAAPLEPPSSTPGRSARRRRRTQEERSAETRARVIRAATDSVVELGFRGATMTAISKRAGVTWGAIQHQFGDKDAILDAVLAESLSSLEAGFVEVGRGAPDPVLRVKRFTARAAELLRGRSYQAFIEIQLNRSRDGAASPDGAWGREVAGALDRAWEAAFGDLALPRRALDESKRFGFLVLAGLAVETMLFPGVDRSRQQLASLRDTLLRIFESPPGCARPEEGSRRAEKTHPADATLERWPITPGGRAPSSTRSTRAASGTRTETASATSRASGRVSTISRGSASTRSGSRPSSARP